MTKPRSSHHGLRIGAVNYLNSKPLVHGLEELAPAARLVYDLPSRLADALSEGRLDVALVPSIELLEDPRYELVSNACVACRGPVLSVKVYFRVPPAQVQSLALDEGSRTSAALAQMLLLQQCGVQPRLYRLPIGEGLHGTSADAVLLIGDRAMHPPAEHFVESWDLGQRWCEFTNLPMVFAVWLARPGVETAALSEVLNEARDAGASSLQAIAHREAPLLGLSPEVCQSYLQDNLHFQLGARERRGLEHFYRRAIQMELAPAGWDGSLYGCSTAQS